MSEGLDSRAAAAVALDTVLARKLPLDEGLARARLERLAPRDTAFARALVMAALRHKGQIDDILSRFMEKRLPKKAGLAQGILLVGAAELLVLKTAAHAAVDCANRIAMSDKDARHFRPLINAVLRRAAGEGAAAFSAQDAARLNTPAWLWQRWCAAMGETGARALAAVHQQEPPTDITVKADTAHWATELEAEILPTGTLRTRRSGRIEDWPGFADGAWWIQDAAAALPARLLRPKAGEEVIDLCAAPGGKTAQLAAAGAKVTAIDVSAKRLARLRENLARLRLPARLITADAAMWQPENLADAVLLDAPCSATGTIRRHPDLPWIKSEADIAAMAALQRRLIENAARMLKPGGRLVYATCSLEREEGENHAQDFERCGFITEPIESEELPGLSSAIDPQLGARIYPQAWAAQGGLDGFFILRARKA
ncbi:MAG: methyltransferase domain-containing protein [Alphaproteobacteria bacterium]|nr:methyltransferase domain-containing protein [Alphaproteobacteria bacterium]